MHYRHVNLIRIRYLTTTEGELRAATLMRTHSLEMNRPSEWIKDYYITRVVKIRLYSFR
jgi:hypothetical protein